MAIVLAQTEIVQKLRMAPMLSLISRRGGSLQRDF